MRNSTLVTCLAGLLLAAGCADSKPNDATTQPSPAATDAMITDSINDSGIRTAIIMQHTLYAYHFVEDGAELNTLGKRDLAVLIAHFRARGGGPLSIRHGDAPDALYAARVSAVQDALNAAGIDPATVQIADASPGGPGMTGSDAVRALDKAQSDQLYGGGSSGGGSSSGGSGSGSGGGGSSGGGGGGGSGSGGGSSGGGQ